MTNRPPNGYGVRDQSPSALQSQLPKHPEESHLTDRGAECELGDDIATGKATRNKDAIRFAQPRSRGNREAFYVGVEPQLVVCNSVSR